MSFMMRKPPEEREADQQAKQEAKARWMEQRADAILKWAGRDSEPEPFTETYEVFALRDRFAGKFDPRKLAAELNYYADAGYRLAGMATADVAGMTIAGGKQEVIFVMERLPREEPDSQ
jgi:hypothetical protein